MKRWQILGGVALIKLLVFQDVALGIGDEAYIYSDISALGVAKEQIERSSDDSVTVWREPGITRIGLPCDCPVDFETSVCFLSVSYPFMVPKELPEDGAMTLEFEGEKGRLTKMKFQYEEIGKFSLVGITSEEAYFVKVHLEPAVKHFGDVENFFFVFDKVKGVLLYGRAHDERLIDHAHVLTDGVSLLASSEGLNGACVSD